MTPPAHDYSHHTVAIRNAMDPLAHALAMREWKKARELAQDMQDHLDGVLQWVASVDSKD